jgi:ABC-2 type transport system permease protein
LEALTASGVKNLRIADTQIEVTNQPINPEGFQRGGFSKFIVSYFSGLLMYITMLIYGIQVMNAVIVEKSSRIMEVLISSVSPLELMVGKICGVGLVALIQYAIWGTSFFLIGFAGSWFEVAEFKALLSWLSPGLVLSIVGFFILGYLMYASLYAAIGAMVEQQQDAQSLHMPVTFLVILPVLILPQVIMEPMQGWVRILSQVPFFAPTLMVTRVASGSVLLWELGLSLLWLALGFLAISALAGKIYQIGVLSYGQRPTLKKIWGYLRS